MQFFSFALKCNQTFHCAIDINWILLTCRDSGNRKGRQKDYEPTMWNEHYDEKLDVVVDAVEGNERTFRVYFAKRDAENKKPLLVLLHGGGYSALTWAHFTVVNWILFLLPNWQLLLYMCLSLLQSEITSILDCQCLAIDLRGHGDSRVSNESDLSANILAK